MKVIYGTGPLVKARSPVVAAIGVFDAVHRGHQALIARAVAEARRRKGTSVVITFHPHPVSVLRPQEFSSYVLPLECRLRLIGQCGADVCVVIPFTKSFSRMSAQDFVRRVLVQKMNVEKVFVGEDFCFGHDRVRSFGAFTGAQGLVAEKVPLVKINNINIKTKKIKELIRQGDLRGVKRFLGRDLCYLSDVVSGDARGRRLGFPTANLRKENVVILPSGIYCVRAFFGRQKKTGVFYIGTRPTFKGAAMRHVLELHILDYKGDLYGRKIMVKFLKKIRDDKRFPDEKSLVARIHRDVASARSFFKKNIPSSSS